MSPMSNASHRPHWFTYGAEVEDTPARVTCDLAHFDRERRGEASTTLLILALELANPTETGLGTPGDAEAIARKTSLIQEFLRAKSPATFHVGAWIAAGTWHVVFYTPPSLDEALIPALVSMVTEEGLPHWIHAEPDPTWSRYESFLLPPTRVRLEATTDRALKTLAHHDLSRPRTITHTLSFPSKEAAELALSSLHLLGFELESPPRSFKDHYTKARVQRKDPPDHLPALTQMLSELCAPLDGDHIHWIATD